MIKNPKVIDLFSGCGGMSLGFQNAGFDVVAAFDNWKPAVATYESNFDHPIFNRDLADESVIEEIRKFKPDLIVGGPPCQDFSSAGHRDESLGRADLTISFTEIVIKIKPKYVVMENVPRIQGSQVFKTVKSKLKKAGYGLTITVIDASRVGTPQARKRLVLIAALGKKDDFLLTKLVAGYSDKQMTLHDYFGDKLGFEHYFRVPRSYQRRGIFSIHEPSMTIRGVDRPVPKGYPGHPGDTAPLSEDIRTLTPKERSLIQTFPDDFIFEGPKTTVNQLVGNAVPVKLAEYVANSLKEHINNE